jgi:two-component system nitrogen regulation sensor histidine kinase GlnL
VIVFARPQSIPFVTDQVDSRMPQEKTSTPALSPEINPEAGVQTDALDLIATAVLLLDRDLRLRQLNAAAESLFAMSPRHVLGQRLVELFFDSALLEEKLAVTIQSGRGFSDQSLRLTRPGHEPLLLNCIVTPFEPGPGVLQQGGLVLEFRHIEQQLRHEREEQRLTQHEANRILIRNLAHEIKNPLGGLRGSAQLLERELDRPELREYTQVIIKEADRLQMLMDRLLAPHRMVQRAPVNIHEVCERVRSLILAEFPSGIRVVRDYDVSLPEFQGDREQLIQAVLNITRNASQALLASPTPEGGARITLRTRAAWQTSIAGRTCRLALELQVVDNGPGIAAELRERIFLPLVSGREGGTGLGLTLAQSFVQNHRGMIECESQPGRTAFRVLFPL